MSFVLKRFSVLGLHGKFDIDIPISDNKLILIGVNGLGKTTVVNIIYFSLTAQWGRLLDYEFSAIKIDVNGSVFLIDREAIERKVKRTASYAKALSRWSARAPMPRRLVEQIVSHPSFSTLPSLSLHARQSVILEMGRDLDISRVTLNRLLAELPSSNQDELFISSDKDPEAISEFLATLAEAKNPQVIYLPTYRRIEQDIKAIFPNLDEDELRRLTIRGESFGAATGRGYVELVRFGMQDVEAKIGEEIQAIRERTRNQLSNLTASYLKDIISNRADAIPSDFFHKLDDETVTAVLDRVEENTLNTQDKHEVKSAIQRLRNQMTGHDARDKYLAYFFSRLMEIYLSLAQSEKNIRMLVLTCNRYFEKKSLQYNEQNFTAQITDDDGADLSWRVLSSGEKQVASLFTHLYLSKNKDQVVIIDEPELSLSVQWQKSLLPDIVNSNRCQLLIAVTHSPFVYANELDAYAVDLSKCIAYSQSI